MIFLNLKRRIHIISVIFILALLFVASKTIRDRELEKFVKCQRLSKSSIVKEMQLSKAFPQAFTSDKEIAILEQRDARKSLLNLKLLGTILGNPAIAYIEDTTSNRQGSYKVGDTIAGVKIVDIQLGRVTLEVNGHREFLDFAETKEEAIIEISPTERIVSRKGILKGIGGDINKAFMMARIWPHFDFVSGKFSGFKINGIQKDSIIEKAGLQNGDVVKVVNNQELNSPQKAIQVFRRIRNQSQIEVDLLRKSRLVRLRYEVKD